MTRVKRWEMMKEHMFVECPAIISEYKKAMGGVDLHDKMTYSCRFAIRLKRCYLYPFWHTLKMAAVNGWFLQCRPCRQNEENAS